ncbi:MAG: hypothetical protein WBW41_15630 [Verrucomicrobiia bacterium]
MNAPENLATQMANKTSDQLLAMFKQPDDWLPEALDAAKTELQRRGVEVSTIRVCHSPTPEGQPKTKEETPSKTLVAVSVALFSSCCLFWFFLFASVYWGHLSPSAQGEATYQMTKSLMGILIAPALLAFCMKGKFEKLLAFSVVFALLTAVAAYYFFDARQKAQEKAAESNRLETDNINSLLEFIKQGATGDLPQFKPTGDADTDAFDRATRDFYGQYLQELQKSRQDIAALQEIDVFDALLLTNKAALETEIQKRIAGQRIIEQFATNAVQMLDDFRHRLRLLIVSDEFLQGSLRGFDKTAPQSKEMFASWVNSQKADEDFLRFLHNNFEDYELKDGKIFFVSQTNVQKYAELSQRVLDAQTKIDEFQKRAMDLLEGSKSKLPQ